MPIYGVEIKSGFIYNLLCFTAAGRAFWLRLRFDNV